MLILPINILVSDCLVQLFFHKSLVIAAHLNICTRFLGIFLLPGLHYSLFLPPRMFYRVEITMKGKLFNLTIFLFLFLKIMQHSLYISWNTENSKKK